MRILLAIVKFVEDRMNVEHDTGVAGVQAILLVEDSVRYYSSFLPVIYTELIDHSHNLMPEGINLSHKLMRLQARPKILLCRTFEEAWERLRDATGRTSSASSPTSSSRASGVLAPRAGVELARRVRDRRSPTSRSCCSRAGRENEALAREAGAAFLLKGSPLLLQELRHFMVENFGFGDFVFRLPDGTGGRAAPPT